MQAETGQRFCELLQVVVFSWTGCPFCKNAKALLDSKGAKYTAVELNTMDEGNAIRAQLAEVSWQACQSHADIQ